MDPRTSSKVTAPDLLEAFQEGTGREPEAVASDLRVWIAYSVNKEVVQTTEHAFDRLDEVMQVVKDFLIIGAGHAVMVVIATEEPDAFKKARESISAADD